MSLSPIEALYEALASPLGIIISTTDVEAMKRRLYALRKEHPEFDGISILTSVTNPATELWIVKRHGQAEHQQTHTEPPGG